MEAFGTDYIVHNLPLLLLSGLDVRDRSHSDVPAPGGSALQEGGFRLRTDLPPLDSKLAIDLRDAFVSYDGSEALWRSQSPSSTSSKMFKIKTVGRTFTLPPRKAPPPPHSPRLSATDGGSGAPPPLVLHSPLSPLTPSSPLYPDGIISALWIVKHQSHLPSAVVTFFSLTTDPNTSSLLDNKIKNETNAMRGVLSSTNYKTRLAVVLIGDGPIEASDLEDRLINIRKAISLDYKSLYFIPFESSQEEVAEFTKSLLSTLHPLCVEYYRDLSKHARRKRNRGSTPQPTTPPTTGHPLPSHGWNARYEFKLGVFAEFRQEMDAACRNYESAYESLFVPEMIDSVTSWSPRFNEARLLSDVIAVRILRCLLWTGQTTNAVRTWTSHRDRTQDLINRRGKGTENYGWEAWQSTWSKTMADLLSRSDQPALTLRIAPNPHIDSIFAGPEKALSVGERTTPWENLQHQGYWLEKSQVHTARRRTLAQQIPTEDRQPPGQTPSSAAANNSQGYDSYLALKPYAEMPADGSIGFDYTKEILGIIEAGELYYAERGQVRKQELLQLKKGLEYLQIEAWQEGATTLKPLWRSQVWRQAGWWKLLQLAGWALLDCALKLQDPELVLRLKWELVSNTFSTKPQTELDIHSSLDGLLLNDNRVDIALDAREASVRIISSFAFVSAEGHVGEPLACQLVLQSSAQSDTRPIALREAKIVFEGSLKPIYLEADRSHNSDQMVEAVSVALDDASRVSVTGSKRTSAGAIASLSGQGNLALSAGQTRVLNMQMTPREAGEVAVASITLMLEGEHFGLTIFDSEFDGLNGHWWETRFEVPMRRAVGPSRDVSRVQILPKPPKVEVQAKSFRQAYYTNETIQLDLEVSNNEEEAVIASVETRLISPVAGAAKIRWIDEPDITDHTHNEDLVQTLSSKDLGSIEPLSATVISVVISNTTAALDHELEVIVNYTLQLDPETILRKVLALDIVFVRPFEANYDFTPKFATDPWPDFFSPPVAAEPPVPQGLIQQFRVTATLVSFAIDPIIVEGILLTSTRIAGGAICTSTTGVLREAEASGDKPQMISTSISPEQSQAFDFSLSVQKLVLGDRHAATLDLALEIGWRRPNSDKVHTTILEVPRFVMPMAEPRVLLTAEEKPSIGSEGMEMNVYLLRYLIENPSMHFLTFNVNMESSEDFAFSGPKGCAVSLVPMSKQEVKYKLLLRKMKESGANRGVNGQGEWIRVQMNVVDAYFNQTLRVQPAVTEEGKDDRVKVDKKGGVVLLVD